MNAKANTSGALDERVSSDTIVRIRVYDIAPSRLNRILSNCGAGGIYHSSVTVYGKEWTFLGHPFKFSGIFYQPDNSPPTMDTTNATTNRTDTSNGPADRLETGMTLSNVISLGQTNLNTQQVHDVVVSLGQNGGFRGCDYHLVRNNCNHFSQEPMVHVILHGDIQLTLTLLGGNEYCSIEEIEQSVEEGVRAARIPGCLPFYPIIRSPKDHEKIRQFFNLTVSPLASADQGTLTINRIAMLADSAYSSAWLLFDFIKEMDDIGCNISAPKRVLNELRSFAGTLSRATIITRNADQVDISSEEDEDSCCAFDTSSDLVRLGSLDQDEGPSMTF
ncbi:hypothetical protein ACOME3_006400 [Neoechinorhynchus agilis]